MVWEGETTATIRHMGEGAGVVMVHEKGVRLPHPVSQRHRRALALALRAAGDWPAMLSTFYLDNKLGLSVGRTAQLLQLTTGYNE